MVRDFTDDTKNMLGNALEDWYDIYSNCPTTDNITATVNIMEENCVLDCWQILDDADQLMHKEKMDLTNQESMLHMLNEIFEEAREYDASQAENVLPTVDIPAEPYISTLRELVEKINFSGLGNDAASVKYNFECNSDEYENSIFGLTDEFKESLDSIGYGILEEKFNELNPETNGWNNFDALMSKNPEDVKLWELRALSMIVDSYLNCMEVGVGAARASMIVDSYLEPDYETRRIILNTTKYEVFLEHCYTLTSFHEGLCQPDVMLTSYTKFELSPVAVLFAGYRAEYTNNLLNMYGDYIYSCDDPYEISLLIAECQANDVLTAMVLYGQEVVEDNMAYRKEKPTMDVTIKPLGDDSNDLTISLFGETEINIYGLSKNLAEEYKSAVNRTTEEGKKDLGTEILGVVGTFFVDSGADYIENLPGIGPVVGMGYKIYSMANNLYSAYQGVEDENSLRDKYIYDMSNSNYINKLYIGGTVIQCGESSIINSIICNQNQLMVDVAFYNINHYDKISVNSLQTAFNSYIRGGEAGVLEDFSKFDNGDIGDAYEDYCDLIDAELKNIREEKQAKGEDVLLDVNIRNATPQELMEAIDRVNRKESSD